MIKTPTDLSEEEWSFDWIKDESTKIKRFGYFYEFGREFKNRLEQYQAKAFHELREGKKQKNEEKINKAKKKIAGFGDVFNEAFCLIEEIASYCDGYGVNITDTPFRSLNENLRDEVLEHYEDEVDNLLTGGSYLHNYGLSLKPIDLEYVKKHPELKNKFEKRFIEFKKEFGIFKEDPEHFWVISKLNYRDSEKQQLRQFKEILRRALISLKNNPDKKLVEEIIKESAMGKNEGKGDYLNHLKALGAFRAVRYYGNWEKAFENTQTVDPNSGYKSPLYSYEKRYWVRSEGKVVRILRKIFGWP